MNPGQEMFLNFMLERAQEGKQEELKQILINSFEEQETTPFTLHSFEVLRGQLLSFIKTEFIAEVNASMDHFASNVVKL